MDWLELLAVQGTLKSLLQHHSSKTSILQPSVFFMVQVSHPHMTTRKTIALPIGPLSAKWCLCFLICYLGWSYIFLQSSKRLLISWLQSPSAVILEPQKIKSVTVSTVFPSISHEVMGPNHTYCLVNCMLLCYTMFIKSHAQLMLMFIVIIILDSLVTCNMRVKIQCNG